MTTIRQRLRAVPVDGGVSIIEVIVAMLIFAIIALGASYSTVTIVKMADDTRARQVATSLATTAIDQARLLNDPFAVVNSTTTTTVGGVTYTIRRSTSWVDTAGTDVACGSGTGNIQNRRVNITVTWAGMLSTTPAVRSDTLLAPDTRVNDPSKGTIRVSVLDVGGAGESGVAVTVTPTSGGAALSSQPKNTDTDGCSIAIKVTPGTYSVAISRAGSVDQNQNANPSQSVVVIAGSSVAAQFQYDYAATYSLTYANNVTGTSPRLPTDLSTSFISTYGVSVLGGRPSSVALHPYPSGYAGIAGAYVAPSGAGAGCVSPDPAAWPAATVSGVPLAAGVRPAPVATTPGGTVAMGIPMGVVNVRATATGFLRAVSTAAPAAAADPGCSVTQTYNFGQVLINGTVPVALPYGSWTLQSATTSTGPWVTITGGNITSLVRSQLSGNVITLDPRVPA